MVSVEEVLGFEEDRRGEDGGFATSFAGLEEGAGAVFAVFFDPAFDGYRRQIKGADEVGLGGVAVDVELADDGAEGVVVVFVVGVNTAGLRRSRPRCCCRPWFRNRVRR